MRWVLAYGESRELTQLSSCSAHIIIIIIILIAIMNYESWRASCDPDLSEVWIDCSAGCLLLLREEAYRLPIATEYTQYTTSILLVYR